MFSYISTTEWRKMSIGLSFYCLFVSADAPRVVLVTSILKYYWITKRKV